MLENWIASLLLKLLGDYIKPECLGDVDMSLWSGYLRLTNVEIKPDVLDGLDAPVTLKRGVIGQVTVQVPWGVKFGAKPTEITFDNLFIVCESAYEWSGNREEKSAERSYAAKIGRVQTWEATLRERATQHALLAKTASSSSPRQQQHSGSIIHNSSSSSQHHNSNSDEQQAEARNPYDSTDVERRVDAAVEASVQASSGSPGFWDKLLAAIVESVVITARGLHIRIEDSALSPGFSTTGGLTAEILRMRSTRSDWVPFDDEGPTRPTPVSSTSRLVYKLVTVKCLALYYYRTPLPTKPTILLHSRPAKAATTSTTAPTAASTTSFDPYVDLASVDIPTFINHLAALIPRSKDREQDQDVPATPTGAAQRVLPSQRRLPTHPYNKYFVLLPTDLEIRLQINKNARSTSAPQLQLSVSIPTLDVQLKENQFHYALEFAAAWSAFQLRRRFAHLRPRERLIVGSRAAGADPVRRRIARDWWRFAVVATIENLRKHSPFFSWQNIKEKSVIRRVYMELHTRRLHGVHAPSEWATGRVRVLQDYLAGDFTNVQKVITHRADRKLHERPKDILLRGLFVDSDDDEPSRKPRRRRHRWHRLTASDAFISEHDADVSDCGSHRRDVPLNASKKRGAVAAGKVLDCMRMTSLLQFLLSPAICHSMWEKWAHKFRVMYEKMCDGSSTPLVQVPDACQEDMQTRFQELLRATMVRSDLDSAAALYQLNAHEISLLQLLEQRMVEDDIKLFRALIHKAQRDTPSHPRKASEEPPPRPDDGVHLRPHAMDDSEFSGFSSDEVRHLLMDKMVPVVCRRANGPKGRNLAATNSVETASDVDESDNENAAPEALDQLSSASQRGSEAAAEGKVNAHVRGPTAASAMDKTRISSTLKGPRERAALRTMVIDSSDEPDSDFQREASGSSTERTASHRRHVTAPPASSLWDYVDFGWIWGKTEKVEKTEGQITESTDIKAAEGFFPSLPLVGGLFSRSAGAAVAASGPGVLDPAELQREAKKKELFAEIDYDPTLVLEPYPKTYEISVVALDLASCSVTLGTSSSMRRVDSTATFAMNELSWVQSRRPTSTRTEIRLQSCRLDHTTWRAEKQTLTLLSSASQALDAQMHSVPVDPDDATEKGSAFSNPTSARRTETDAGKPRPILFFLYDTLATEAWRSAADVKLGDAVRDTDFTTDYDGDKFPKHEFGRKDHDDPESVLADDTATQASLGSRANPAFSLDVSADRLSTARERVRRTRRNIRFSKASKLADPGSIRGAELSPLRSQRDTRSISKRSQTGASTRRLTNIKYKRPAWANGADVILQLEIRPVIIHVRLRVFNEIGAFFSRPLAAIARTAGGQTVAQFASVELRQLQHALTRRVFELYTSRVCLGVHIRVDQPTIITAIDESDMNTSFLVCKFDSLRVKSEYLQSKWALSNLANDLTDISGIRDIVSDDDLPKDIYDKYRLKISGLTAFMCPPKTRWQLVLDDPTQTLFPPTGLKVEVAKSVLPELASVPRWRISVSCPKLALRASIHHLSLLRRFLGVFAREDQQTNRPHSYVTPADRQPDTRIRSSVRREPLMYTTASDTDFARLYASPPSQGISAVATKPGGVPTSGNPGIWLDMAFGTVGFTLTNATKDLLDVAVDGINFRHRRHPSGTRWKLHAESLRILDGLQPFGGQFEEMVALRMTDGCPGLQIDLEQAALTAPAPGYHFSKETIGFYAHPSQAGLPIPLVQQRMSINVGNVHCYFNDPTVAALMRIWSETTPSRPITTAESALPSPMGGDVSSACTLTHLSTVEVQLAQLKMWLHTDGALLSCLDVADFSTRYQQALIAECASLQEATIAEAETSSELQHQTNAKHRLVNMSILVNVDSATDTAPESKVAPAHLTRGVGSNPWVDPFRYNKVVLRAVATATTKVHVTLGSWRIEDYVTPRDTTTPLTALCLEPPGSTLLDCQVLLAPIVPLHGYSDFDTVFGQPVCPFVSQTCIHDEQPTPQWTFSKGRLMKLDLGKTRCLVSPFFVTSLCTYFVRSPSLRALAAPSSSQPRKPAVADAAYVMRYSMILHSPVFEIPVINVNATPMRVASGLFDSGELRLRNRVSQSTETIEASVSGMHMDVQYASSHRLLSNLDWELAITTLYSSSPDINARLAIQRDVSISVSKDVVTEVSPRELCFLSHLYRYSIAPIIQLTGGARQSSPSLPKAPGCGLTLQANLRTLQLYLTEEMIVGSQRRLCVIWLTRLSVMRRKTLESCHTEARVEAFGMDDLSVSPDHPFSRFMSPRWWDTSPPLRLAIHQSSATVGSLRSRSKSPGTPVFRDMLSSESTHANFLSLDIQERFLNNTVQIEVVAEAPRVYVIPQILSQVMGFAAATQSGLRDPGHVPTEYMRLSDFMDYGNALFDASELVPASVSSEDRLNVDTPDAVAVQSPSINLSAKLRKLELWLFEDPLDVLGKHAFVVKAGELSAVFTSARTSADTILGLKMSKLGMQLYRPQPEALRRIQSRKDCSPGRTSSPSIPNSPIKMSLRARDDSSLGDIMPLDLSAVAEFPAASETVSLASVLDAKITLLEPVSCQVEISTHSLALGGQAPRGIVGSLWSAVQQQLEVDIKHGVESPKSLLVIRGTVEPLECCISPFELKTVVRMLTSVLRLPASVLGKGQTSTVAPSKPSTPYMLELTLPQASIKVVARGNTGCLVQPLLHARLSKCSISACQEPTKLVGSMISWFQLRVVNLMRNTWETTVEEVCFDTRVEIPHDIVQRSRKRSYSVNARLPLCCTISQSTVRAATRLKACAEKLDHNVTFFITNCSGQQVWYSLHSKQIESTPSFRGKPGPLSPWLTAQRYTLLNGHTTPVRSQKEYFAGVAESCHSPLPTITMNIETDEGVSHAVNIGLPSSVNSAGLIVEAVSWNDQWHIVLRTPYLLVNNLPLVMTIVTSDRTTGASTEIALQPGGAAFLQPPNEANHVALALLYPDGNTISMPPNILKEEIFFGKKPWVKVASESSSALLRSSHGSHVALLNATRGASAVKRLPDHNNSPFPFPPTQASAHHLTVFSIDPPAVITNMTSSPVKVALSPAAADRPTKDYVSIAASAVSAPLLVDISARHELRVKLPNFLGDSEPYPLGTPGWLTPVGSRTGIDDTWLISDKPTTPQWLTCVDLQGRTLNIGVVARLRPSGSIECSVFCPVSVFGFPGLPVYISQYPKSSPAGFRDPGGLMETPHDVAGQAICAAAVEGDTTSAAGWFQAFRAALHKVDARFGRFLPAATVPSETSSGFSSHNKRQVAGSLPYSVSGGRGFSENVPVLLGPWANETGQRTVDWDLDLRFGECHCRIPGTFESLGTFVTPFVLRHKRLLQDMYNFVLMAEAPRSTASYNSAWHIIPQYAFMNKSEGVLVVLSTDDCSLRRLSSQSAKSRREATFARVHMQDHVFAGSDAAIFVNTTNDSPGISIALLGPGTSCIFHPSQIMSAAKSVLVGYFANVEDARGVLTTVGLEAAALLQEEPTILVNAPSYVLDTAFTCGMVSSSVDLQGSTGQALLNFSSSHGDVSPVIVRRKVDDWDGNNPALHTMTIASCSGAESGLPTFWIKNSSGFILEVDDVDAATQRRWRQVLEPGAFALVCPLFSDATRPLTITNVRNCTGVASKEIVGSISFTDRKSSHLNGLRMRHVQDTDASVIELEDIEAPIHVEHLQLGDVESQQCVHFAIPAVEFHFVADDITANPTHSFCGAFGRYLVSVFMEDFSLDLIRRSSGEGMQQDDASFVVCSLAVFDVNRWQKWPWPLLEFHSGDSHKRLPTPNTAFRILSNQLAMSSPSSFKVMETSSDVITDAGPRKLRGSESALRLHFSRASSKERPILDDSVCRTTAQLECYLGFVDVSMAADQIAWYIECVTKVLQSQPSRPVVICVRESRQRSRAFRSTIRDKPLRSQTSAAIVSGALYRRHALTSPQSSQDATFLGSMQIPPADVLTPRFEYPTACREIVASGFVSQFALRVNIVPPGEKPRWWDAGMASAVRRTIDGLPLHGSYTVIVPKLSTAPQPIRSQFTALLTALRPTLLDLAVVALLKTPALHLKALTGRRAPTLTRQILADYDPSLPLVPALLPSLQHDYGKVLCHFAPVYQSARLGRSNDAISILVLLEHGLAYVNLRIRDGAVGVEPSLCIKTQQISAVAAADNVMCIGYDTSSPPQYPVSGAFSVLIFMPTPSDAELASRIINDCMDRSRWKLRTSQDVIAQLSSPSRLPGAAREELAAAVADALQAETRKTLVFTE